MIGLSKQVFDSALQALVEARTVGITSPAIENGDPHTVINGFVGDSFQVFVEVVVIRSGGKTTYNYQIGPVICEDGSLFAEYVKTPNLHEAAYYLTTALDPQ